MMLLSLGCVSDYYVARPFLGEQSSTTKYGFPFPGPCESVATSVAVISEFEPYIWMQSLQRSTDSDSLNLGDPKQIGEFCGGSVTCVAAL